MSAGDWAGVIVIAAAIIGLIGIAKGLVMLGAFLLFIAMLIALTGFLLTTT